MEGFCCLLDVILEFNTIEQLLITTNLTKNNIVLETCQMNIILESFHLFYLIKNNGSALKKMFSSKCGS